MVFGCRQVREADCGGLHSAHSLFLYTPELRIVFPFFLKAMWSMKLKILTF